MTIDDNGSPVRPSVKTATEARSAEPGLSVLALLAVSTGLAFLVMGLLWFLFFRL